MSFKSHKTEADAKAAEAAMYSAEATAVAVDPVVVVTPTSVPPELLPGTLMETFNGKPITVGDTVCLPCKVVAVDPLDAHYGEVQCVPLYPGLGVLFIPNIQSGQVPQSRAFEPPTPEGGPVFGFHPKQLVEFVPPELPPATLTVSPEEVKQ